MRIRSHLGLEWLDAGGKSEILDGIIGIEA